MRRVATLLLVTTLLITGCGQVVSGPTPTPELLAVTLPPPSPTYRVTAAQTKTPEPTATPAPTSTPIIYVVQPNDTLLSIALEFGSSVASIQQANGIINPTLLRPGQELIIPVGSGGAESAKQILPTPTPVAARVQGLSFYEESVGSLRCRGEVFNPNAGALENVRVRIMLKDAAGQVLAEAEPFTFLDVIPPNGRAPFDSLFTSPPAHYATYEAIIIRAEPSNEPGTRYAALQIISQQGGTDGLQFRVTGKARNTSDRPAANVKIIATAYDASGKVLGFRQQALGDGNLAAGATRDFSISFAPNGGTPTQFQVYAEGRFAQ